MAENIKVLFTIAGLQAEYGGPSTSVPALATAVAQAGASVDLVTCAPATGQAPPNLPATTLVNSQLVAPENRTKHWSAGRNAFARHLLDSDPDRYSVVHDNGLWLPNNHVIAAAARRAKLPRIVSPRGMLSQWARRHRGLKKSVAWWVYQKRDLESAEALHATSKEELLSIREAGLHQPVVVLPNGVDLPKASSVEEKVPNSNTRTILFLGRIHPIKGLPDLIKAWAMIKMPGWRVILAGPEDPEHRRELDVALKQTQLEAAFTFLGPVAAESKWALYRQADLFVLPSHSENFGIAVAEALACGVPVVTTRGTPWKELLPHRCGWWTEIGPGALAAALHEAMTLSDLARHEMGQRGKRWIESQFAWPVIGASMLAAYRWMIGAGRRPDCVME